MPLSSIPSLTESSRQVLRVVASSGPITRPRLGAILNLSKPTMTAVMNELGALGLVAPIGSQQGAMGRSAAVYALGPAAGYVIGIDVGVAQVRAVAQGLDGSPLAAVELKIGKQQRATIEEIASIVDEAAKAAILAVGSRGQVLRSIAVAVPRIVSKSRLGQNKRRSPEAVLQRLRHSVDAPILLENNVNCAAFGELHNGVAKGRDIFIFLQVGVRIGLGIVIGGKLFRGFNGAAGEAGRIPFPWSANEVPEREGIEHYLGSDALMERCIAGWSTNEPPASARELFDRAEQGEKEALVWVNKHAADIGRMVAGCIGLFDPGLVVLGGGVGQNPFILEEVRHVSRELTWATEIASSTLGANGTVIGATRLAAHYALATILGETPDATVVLSSNEAVGDEPQPSFG
ncbi:ROK family transcriptional regulator [Neorhizobium sp. P12A]|uniref:ROK family transcriptional regulator n=1 Tax=Neorhizobium sp. P12A TaxID=2268027 RepID=UPI0011EDEE56|nr:ROK family transcriptional regulator [Neorhizobium sp. P12A]KAA0697844.1 ROK family transcriptional regulator [Neorhizobium sp. P12A]